MGLLGALGLGGAAVLSHNAQPTGNTVQVPPGYQNLPPDLSQNPPFPNLPDRPTYKTGQILSGPEEVYTLAAIGKVQSINRIHSQKQTLPAFYEILLKDGTVLVLDPPERVEDEQAFNRTLRTEYGFSIARKTPEQSVLLGILTGLAGPLLILGIIYMVLRNRAKAQGGGLGGLNNTQQFDIKMDVPTRFSDVKGYPEVLEELDELVKLTKEYARSSDAARPPKGVLLTGPPGTGKTLMGKAMAGESDMPFIYISGSQFTEMFVGVGAARIRNLFAAAKDLEQKYGGCYIFIDELDAIGKKRADGSIPSGGGDSEREQTLNQLLVEMDGFDKDHNIVVLAATNRPDVLDDGLTRAGRFDRKVSVDKPRTAQDRLEILELYARKLKLADDVDLAGIARIAKGFVGADLENLAKEALSHASRKGRTEVTQQDLVDAIGRVTLGIARPKRGSDKQRELAAVHEHGHGWNAVAAKVPVFIVSMIPRGDALAHVRPDPDEGFGEGVETREGLLRQMLITVGGRAAEEIRYGKDSITSGAGQDLQQFEQIFRYMRSTALLGDSRENYLNGKELTSTDRQLMENLYQNALRTGIQVIQTLAPEQREAMVRESLALASQGQDLIGDAANQFYKDMAGPDFDWDGLYKLVERFIQNPIPPSSPQPKPD